MTEIDKLVDELAKMAMDLGLNIEQIKDCLNKATTKPSTNPFDDLEAFQPVSKKNSELERLENEFAVAVDEDEAYTAKDFLSDEGFDKEGAQNKFDMSFDEIVNYLENKRRELIGVSDVTLNQDDASDFYRRQDARSAVEQKTGDDEQKTGDPGPTNPFLRFGKTAFGRKILSKATESVRRIAKKKGIYVVGRKGKKFLGIRFTKKGNYSKNKKGRPNGKMYTLDGLRKMKKKKVSFKKLPQLIDMMDTGAVLKKHKDFKFGFELKKQRSSGGCGFGYTFPVGAGYGRSSALLYGKL